MCIDTSTVDVTSCKFISNTTLASGQGGGMAVYSSTVTLLDCVFTSNSASYGGYGGAVFLASNEVDGFSGSINLYGCSFSKNEATYGGDLARWSPRGSITVFITCPAGYASFYAVRGAYLDLHNFFYFTVFIQLHCVPGGKLPTSWIF